MFQDKKSVWFNHPGDQEKVYSILKHLVRDWTADGARERELCYNPVINKIEELFPNKTLVPMLIMRQLQ